MGEILPFQADPAFLYRAGKRAYDESDYSTAVVLLRKALDGQPDNIDYRVDLSLCYIEMGALDEARSVLEEAIVTADKIPDAICIAYAHCFVADGNLRVAIGLLQRVKEEDIANYIPDNDDEDAPFDPDDYAPDIALADDSYDVAVQLHDLVEDEDIQGALELLNTIDKRSVNYPEALKAVAMIYLATDKPKKAKPYFEKTLAIRPDDVFALTGMIVVDAAHADDYLKSLSTVTPRSNGEVNRMCYAAVRAGVTPLSLELVDKLYAQFPYQKRVLEAAAKLHYAMGDIERAQEIALTARRLYPDDCTFSMLNRAVQNGETVALDDGAGKAEAMRRIETLESWLEKKSSIGAVVKGLKENRQMNETVRWLFQTEMYGVQVSVGCFLAQSLEWQPFIREQLLKDVPDALKFEYIRSLLFYAPDKRYRLISGDDFYEYLPVPPVKADETLTDAYYTAFAALSISQDDFTEKLNRLYKTLVYEFDGEPKKPFDDPALIAAAMLCAGRWRKPPLKMRDFSDIFNLSEREITDYKKVYFTQKREKE